MRAAQTRRASGRYPADAPAGAAGQAPGSSTACTADAKCNLISEGLTRARATPEADKIVVDPGLYTQTVDLSNVADAGLTLQGAGSGEGGEGEVTSGRRDR